MPRLILIVFLLAIGCANTNTWPDGRIPIYYYHPGISAEEFQTITAGIMFWDFITGGRVKFIPKDHPADEKEPDIVTIISVNEMIAYTSTYGYRKGQSKWIMICKSKFNMKVFLHESMHIIGFTDEHTRPDRDENVIVKWDNISKYSTGIVSLLAFSKVDPNTYDYSQWAYDRKSLMHYGRNNDGGPDLFEGGPDDFGSDWPSPEDIRKIKAMYRRGQVWRP